MNRLHCPLAIILLALAFSWLGCSDDPGNASTADADLGTVLDVSDDSGAADAADAADATDAADADAGETSDGSDSGEPDADAGPETGDASRDVEADVTPPAVCGNGVREQGEACDGDDVPAACVGWSQEVSCTGSCELSACRGRLEVIAPGTGSISLEKVSDDGSRLFFFTSAGSGLIDLYSLEFATGSVVSVAPGFGASVEVFPSHSGQYAVLYESPSTYYVWAEPSASLTQLPLKVDEDNIYMSSDVVAFFGRVGFDPLGFHVYDHASGQTTEVLADVDDPAGRFPVSADGQYAAVWTADSWTGPFEIHFVDLSAGAVLASAPAEASGSGRFSPTGNSFVFEKPGGLSVWLAATNTIIDAPSGGDMPHVTRFSPDTTKLAYAEPLNMSGDRNEAWLWDLQANTEIPISQDAGSVFEFSDDGSKLAYYSNNTSSTSSSESEIRIWDVTAHTDFGVDSVATHEYLRWSPAGDAIAYLDASSNSLDPSYDLKVAEVGNAAVSATHSVAVGGHSPIVWHPDSQGLWWLSSYHPAYSQQLGYWDRASGQSTTLLDDLSEQVSVLVNPTWDHIVAIFSGSFNNPGAPITSFETDTQTSTELTSNSRFNPDWFDEGSSQYAAWTYRGESLSPVTRFLSWQNRDAEGDEIGPLHVYDLATGTTTDLAFMLQGAKLSDSEHGADAIAVVEIVNPSSVLDPDVYSLWIYRP